MKKLLIKLAFKILYWLGIPSLSPDEWEYLFTLKKAFFERYNIKW